MGPRGQGTSSLRQELGNLKHFLQRGDSEKADNEKAGRE
jgi:hypothetical protein